MQFVQRFWRFFRLSLLIAAFFAVTLYLAATTNWEKIFGWQPKYEAVITEGQPLVQAIYCFKAQQGLWPEYLDDLVPTYLPRDVFKNVETQWYYTVAPDGRPGLSKGTDVRRTHVGFDFDPVNPSWRVFGDDDNRVLKTLTPASAAGPGGAATLPAEKVAENALAELDRRIASAKSLMEHRRAKASLLWSLGRKDEARKVVEDAAAWNGHHFWPRLALVAMDLDQKPEARSRNPEATAATSTSAPAAEIPKSVADFEAWVRGEPTFTHWYYLSLIDRWIGRDADAIAAIEEAAKLPPVTTDDFEVPAFFLWDMARFALKQEKWDIVLKLATGWEQLQSDDRRKKEFSYLPLAAAAKLAQGDAAGAKKDMETLRQEKTATWAQHVDALDAAIQKNDRAFRYDPGDKPPAFKVFAVPE